MTARACANGIPAWRAEGRGKRRLIRMGLPAMRLVDARRPFHGASQSSCDRDAPWLIVS